MSSQPAEQESQLPDVSPALQTYLSRRFAEQRAEVRQAAVDGVRLAMADRLVDVPEACRLLGLTEAAMRKRIASGSMPTVRFGRSIRFRLSDLMTAAGGKGEP